ncbi:MAG: hypothetical protein Q9167_003774 [Letrouitia subvulpina]
MKTPYYTGAFTAAQHTNVQDDDQIRERMLEYRLANRDDVRDIYVVTAPPTDCLSGTVGENLVKQASKRSKTDLSWAMHWAIQVGDQYFELQRAYYDPTRTGLRMSNWDQQKQNQIHQRYRQGVTAMTDDEIQAVGVRHFSRLNRMHINKYDLWCNNCQVAVDRMLRDIGGLRYYRSQLKSLHEWIRKFFCDAMLSVVRMYYRHRGCDKAEELLTRHEEVLRNAVNTITSRSIHYPKRQWIREDIEAAEGIAERIGAVKDHWFLTVLESSLSLRKGSENSYVRRGPDGKPELNFDAVRGAVKGLFDEDGKSAAVSWLRATPWLTAGFLVGTTNWAVAVISIAVSRVSQLLDNGVGIKGGLEESLGGLGVSPKLHDAQFKSSTTSKPRVRRLPTNEIGTIKVKSKSIDEKLVARYEKRSTNKGVPYFYDHMNKSRSWEVPDQQELCLKITNPPLSKKWQERQEQGRVFYVNLISGETTDTRPGAAEIWVVKKRVKPDWVKPTIIALPSGWEMCRTEEGEKYYLDHKNDPPTSTTLHPMRQEIEGERQVLLPEWNVEWDEDRGKKYRNLPNGEIRWKAVDGPKHFPADGKARYSSKRPQQDFVEPLPPGWISSNIEANGQKIYQNPKEGVERLTHPLTDKRRRLLPDWEMRYTPGNKRYWVHYGRDGRGTSWWTRNKRLKNTSLKNNANGWKLAKNGHDWEWFEGGDVPHSEIPVLDLDDPAEIEFREYPFILPYRLTSLDGTFIEPLPANWVTRTEEDGRVYYWNFRTETRSDLHPNEEERKNLPALWEMRYTRHGRPYFFYHYDGSTFWTHPRPQEAKQEQKLRAQPGQGQDGWKVAEDGKSWERFADKPDYPKLAQEDTNNLTHTQSAESEDSRDGEEMWRSLGATKERLRRGVSESDVVATARGHLSDLTKVFKKAEKSPKTGREVAMSPPAIVEEPQELEEELQPSQEPSPEQKNPRKSWTKRTSSLFVLKKMKKKGKKGVENCGEPESDKEDLRSESITGMEGLGFVDMEGDFEFETVVTSPMAGKEEGSNESLKTRKVGHISEDETAADSKINSKEEELKKKGKEGI